MSDRYDENLFLGFIEGDLTPAERLRFERQLAIDPALRQLVEQVRQDRQELRQTVPEVPPPEIMETVNQALERAMLLDQPVRRPQQAWRQQHLRLVRWSAYGAVAALALVSTGVVVHTLLQEQVSPPHQSGGVGPLVFKEGAGSGESGEMSASIASVAMVLDNNGRAEVGTGGQFAMLVPAADSSAGFGRDAARANEDSIRARQEIELAVRDQKMPTSGHPADRGPMLKGGPARGDLGIVGQTAQTGASNFMNNSVNVTGNVTGQRIDVAARNSRLAQDRLVDWAVTNGGTVIADTQSTLTLGNAANNSAMLINAGRLGGNDFNTNSNLNVGAWNDRSGNYAGNASMAQTNAQQAFTNPGAAANPVLLTVVVAPEKVPELVRYFNAKGDQAFLADAPADTPVQAAATGRLSANAPAGPAGSAAAAAIGAPGSAAASAAATAPAEVTKAIGALGSSPPGAPSLDPDSTMAQQRVVTARAAPVEDEAEKYRLRAARYEQAQREGLARVPASLHQTPWALILSEQLPLASPLSLPPPSESAGTMTIPVLIVEQAP